MNKTKIPHLRLCATKDCCYRCIYCRPGGESCSQSNIDQVSPQQIISMVELIVSNGVSEIKVTGGEPMLRSDILDIIHGIRGIKGVNDVQLITMSPKAGKRAKEIKDSGISCLNFSLDSLDPQVFREVNGGVNCLPELLGAIDQCYSAGIPLKFNMVVLKNINHSEIPAMIEFAGKYGATLKLLDLMQVSSNHVFFYKHYVPFGPIMEKLSETATNSMTVWATGGIGTPMMKYDMPNGATVLIKDASVGTWYSDVCEGCQNYPCQDAIMALRLTSDGFLQRCMLREDQLVNMLSAIENGEGDHMVKQVLSTYQNAEYRKAMWNPL